MELEQQEILERLARIAQIHPTFLRESGEVKPASLIGTVGSSVSSLVQAWLNARDPMLYKEERDGVASQIGTCFIILIHLCGVMGIDPLVLIDEEFSRQLKGLETQRAAMKAMTDIIGRQKNGAPPA